LFERATSAQKRFFECGAGWVRDSHGLYYVAHSTKQLSTKSDTLVFMAKLNQVRKSGGSMIIAIPPSMGVGIGDWMRFQKEDGGNVTMIKVFDGDDE